jgi:apolipoprotein N-acyltransferase
VTERVLLPWLALVPLVWLIGRPRAPLLGLVHGTTAWVVSIPWIVPTVITYGGLSPALAVTLFLLLALYLGAYHALFVWLGRPLWRRGGVVAVLGLPALWCLLEVARAWVLSGFPWNQAGYAWIAMPGALPLSAWTSVYGLSFLLVFASAGIALGIARRGVEPAAIPCLVALLILAFGARWGGPDDPPPGRELPVRILQPNTPILDGDDSAAIAAAYAEVLRMTRAACDRRGALVVWPESAAWPHILERDPTFRADVERAAAEGGCAILLNSPRFEGERVYNTAFLMAPDGRLGHYDKRHLVPFGEFVPLARLLPFVGALARNAGSFSASEELSLLRFGEWTIGVSICFEVTFPSEVAALSRAGALALVTITNDAWYGDSTAPWQHLRAARFRAAENHRTILRAALTGVSAWIEPDGSLASSLGVGEEGILRGELHGRDQLTLYARAPWAVPALCAVLYPSAILASRRARGTASRRARA